MADRQILVPVNDPVRSFLPPEYWNRGRDFFVYSVDYNTLAASAVQSTQSYQVDVDSDFLCLAMSYVVATTAAGTTEQTFPLPTIMVRDSGSGAAWFNLAQNLGNVAGRQTVDGAGPYRLAYPRLVVAGSAVTVELTNLEATARRLWIAFHGMKIFRNRAFAQR